MKKVTDRLGLPEGDNPKQEWGKMRTGHNKVTR